MSSKNQQLRKFMVLRIMYLKDNLQQWALADSFIGEEHMLRLKQASAIIEDDTHAAHEIHDERIRCLEKALETLRNCPACGPHEEAPR